MSELPAYVNPEVRIRKLKGGLVHNLNAVMVTSQLPIVESSAWHSFHYYHQHRATFNASTCEEIYKFENAIERLLIGCSGSGWPKCSKQLFVVAFAPVARDIVCLMSNRWDWR